MIEEQLTSDAQNPLEKSHKLTNSATKQKQNRTITHQTNVSMLKNIIQSQEEIIKQQSFIIIELRNKVQQKEVDIQKYELENQNKLQLQKRVEQLQTLLSNSKVQLAMKSSDQQEQFKTNNSMIFDKSSQPSSSDHNRSKSMSIDLLSISKEKLSDYVEIEPIWKQEDENLSNIHKNKLGDQNIQIRKKWLKALELYTNISEVRKQKFKTKTTQFIDSFIPSDLRVKIWPLIFDNNLGITNSLYIELLERKNNGWVSSKVCSQIEKDITRSFCSKTQYDNYEKLSGEVTEMLQIFHIFRPDISYVQGMTYPAIVLILIVGKIKAFTIFSNLILANQFFRKLFSFETDFVAICCRTFDKLLKEYQPNVANKLEKYGIMSEIFLVQWFFTFFSRGMSFPNVLKTWDYLAYYGSTTIYKLSLSIFELIGEKIISADYQNTISLIRQFPAHLNEKKLINNFVVHKLTTQKLKKVFERVSKQMLTCNFNQ